MRIWPHGTARTQLLLTSVIAVALTLMFESVTGQWTVSVLCGFCLGVFYYYVSMKRYYRRRRLVSEPFPREWRSILESQVAFYRKLDQPGRRRFENDVRIFVSEQSIYGLRGAPVKDDIKVLIAASAAILGHGIPDWEWPSVRDIVVYPSPFDENYNTDGEKQVAGLVHSQGPILFSESDLRHGFSHPGRGLHVGLHELAHVMDMADGSADGIPAGLTWVSTAPWVRIISDRLQRVRRRDCRNILRSYAGVDEVEFFAVAVEVFFEQPKKLREQDRELYDLLASYFNIDPITGRIQSTFKPPQ
jgi:MtfA peptidase